MEKLILNNDVLNRINDLYNKCIKLSVSGEDTVYNEIKLEVLYELRVKLWKMMQIEEFIEGEIVDSWTVLQVYKILINLRETKGLELEDLDLYDTIATEIFIDVADDR